VREATADNFESLDHFRAANRIGFAYGEFDISANITTEIPRNGSAPGELPAPACSAEDPVPRFPEGPESWGQTEVLEAAFRWKDAGSGKPRTLPHSVKILCLIAFTTMIAYFGLDLFLWLLKGLKALKPHIEAASELDFYR